MIIPYLTTKVKIDGRCGSKMTLETTLRDTVGATPLVDSGWHNLLIWAQKLQSGRLTHFVDQQTCCCVRRIPTYTSLFLQFKVTHFVDLGPTTNQRSVRSTNFVDVDDFTSNQHSWRLTNFVDSLLTQNPPKKYGQKFW